MHRALLLFCSLFSALVPGAGAEAGSWQIIDSQAVLANQCHWQDGLVFTDAQALTWELVTHFNDPAVTNQGEGRFYPVNAATVASALAQLDPAIQSRLSGTIYILPYPRRDLMHSSSDGQAIYLSPTVVPATVEMVHFLLYHEIGHLVHRQLVPDTDRRGWAIYLEWAGIVADGNPRSLSLRRLHEQFAEAFRLCFGSETARQYRPPVFTESTSTVGMNKLTIYFSRLLGLSRFPVTAPAARHQLAATGGDIPAFAVAD